MFLREIEHELFQIPDKCFPFSSPSKEAEDRYIFIKKSGEGLCLVVWDRLDYLSEAEKQLVDKNVYKGISFSDKILCHLVETSNKMYLNIKRKGSISEKEMKYFLHDYKNASNLGKLYFPPKIHKRLFDVPGRPVISNCGTPTEKTSEFLDYHLKPVMQSIWSYIKD